MDAYSNEDLTAISRQFADVLKLEIDEIVATRIARSSDGTPLDVLRLLADTMKFRNAFAHGQFHVNQQTVSLSFYQDKPQTQELSDKFLKLVEKTLRDANNQTENLAIRMGVKNILTYDFDQTTGETPK